MNKDSLPESKNVSARNSQFNRASRGRTIGLLIRELVGWGLLLLGLNIFRISFVELDERRVVEAAIAAFIGLIVFRAGMQLLKVAVAARALLAERQHQPVAD